ncbi:ABC transporter permease [Dactylosporangium sp. NPDC051484]|uniref:ABC transporter permease n=1 Tax=Dactylosporangium sp. NPDC051484 TaxID=3154942 RepID=UPI00344D3562
MTSTITPATSATPATVGSAATTARRGGDLRILVHQIRYEQLTFWRNPQAMIFTFIFPLAFMTIVGAVFRGGTSSEFFYGHTGLQYYTATIAALSVLGACYGQLAIALAMRRQTGVLKRVHATPLPAWIYFAGLLAHCVLVSVIEVALIVGVGAAYRVPMPVSWGVLAVTLVLGAASFCALGAGVSALVRNPEAAPAVVQFVQLPLLFLSGTYFPIHSSLLTHVGDVLPVKPFNDAILAAFTTNAHLKWTEQGVLLAWGVAGAIVAVLRFRWDPRPE